MITYSYISSLLSGIAITLLLMLGSLSLGIVLSLGITALSLTEKIILNKCIAFFIFFIRGTPLLVQIYLIYYGAGQFECLRNTIVWPMLREPMVCAILALAINSACYTTVILKGAIESVPQNEKMACAAIGMSTWQSMRYVIFPHALRLMMPAYSNEVIFLLKGTSLASTITLLDIMGVTQRLINETYDVITWYSIAAIIYLALNAVITFFFYRIIAPLHKHH